MFLSFFSMFSDLLPLLTRNQVAQMALNALQSNMVRFTGTPGITVDNVTVGYKAEYTFRTSTEQKYNALVQNKTDIALQGQYYIQLGEELYDGKLTKRFARDDFERPGYNWQFEGKDIGTYVDYTLKRAEYTEGVKGETLYDLLTYTTINENDLLRYVDGEKKDMAKTVLARSNKKNIAESGNGVLTEVFVDDLRDEVTITSISTWLAKANSDYNTSTETLSLKVYYTDSTGRTFTVDGEDVPASVNVKKDDFVLVNISKKESITNPEVVKIGTPEIISDTAVTKWSKSGTLVLDKLTTGGTEYKSNVKAFYDAGNVFGDYNEQLLTDNTYNVYVDKYGYAVGVDLHEGTKNYVFITGYDRGTSHISIKTAEAAAIFMDGTMEVITVNVTDTNKNIDRMDGVMNNNTSGNPYFVQWNGNGNVSENRWYTYTVSNNGTYTLNPAKRMFATDRISPFSATQVLNSANLFVQDNGTTTWNGATPITGSSTRAYGEDASIYITVEPGRVDLSDANTSYEDAITEVNGVYTGAQDVKMELTADTQKQVPNAVYTLYDSDNYIIASIVLGEAQGSTTNYAYILGGAKSERIERESSSRANGDVTYYWEFDAVVNGEKTTLTAKTKYPSSAMLSPYTVQELRYDGEYVTDVKGVNNSKFHTSNETNANIENRDVYDVGHVAGTAWVNDTTGIMDATSATLVGGNGAQSGRIDDTLDLQGRTLKTKSGSEVALALARDAKAVVVQMENGSREVTNCASVADAIARLADRNVNTAGVQFKGRIVAVLDTLGVAQWVVFISDTELVSGNNPDYNQNQTGEGGVMVAESFTGSKKPTMTGASTTTVNAFGIPVVSFNATVPEWAVGTVNFTYNLYVNDTIAVIGKTTGALTIGAEQKVAASNLALSRDITSGVLKPSDAIRVEITDATYSDVKVKFVDNTDATKTVAVAAGSTETIKVAALAAATDLKVQVDETTTTYTAATLAGVDGVTDAGATLNVASVKGSVVNVYSANYDKVTVDGDGYVVVKLTLTGAAPKPVTYTVAKSATFDTDHADIDGAVAQTTPTAVTLDKFGVTGATTDKLAVTWNPAGPFSAGASVTFTATVTGTTDAVSYDVTIDTSVGKFVIEDVKNGTAGTKYYTFPADGANMVINDVTAKIHTPKLAKLAAKDVSINAAGNEITIKFNTGVCKTNATTKLDASCFTLTAGTSSATIIDVIHTAGDATVTVKVSAPLADAETLATKADILNAGATSDVANVDTITVDLTGGVYSIEKVENA
jgi:hypothetical protein